MELRNVSCSAGHRGDWAECSLHTRIAGVWAMATISVGGMRADNGGTVGVLRAKKCSGNDATSTSELLQHDYGLIRTWNRSSCVQNIVCLLRKQRNTMPGFSRSYAPNFVSSARILVCTGMPYLGGSEP